YSRKQSQRCRLGYETRPRQVQLGLDTFVASSPEPSIHPERGTKHHAVASGRSIGADDEWQRAEQPRRDPRKGTALEDRCPRAIDGPGLKQPQTAVNRLLMIERRAAAEVLRLDEGSAEPAARSIVGGRQTVHTAADDQKVVRLSGEAIEIA